MSTKFPSSIKSLRKKHPQAGTLVQMRILTEDGSVIAFEGPVAQHQAQAAFKACTEGITVSVR